MGYTKDQQQEALSLIHNELQCVSIGSLAYSMGISRRDASKLLRNAAEANTTYQATFCSTSTTTEKNNGEGDVLCTGKE